MNRATGATLDVPRRLYAHILFNYGQDVQTFIWRRRWLSRLCDLAVLVAAGFSFFLVVFLIVLSESSSRGTVPVFPWLLTMGCLVTELAFARRALRYRRALRRLERTSGLDWKRIDSQCIPVLLHVRPGDPRITVPVDLEPEDVF